MKIRDLNIVDKSDLYKLNQYADMSVEEYAAWIKKKKADREPVARTLLKLYEKIIDGQIDSSFSVQDEKPEAKDPIYYELEKIPIEEIQYYVDYKDYNKNCGKLRRKGIRNLGQLYDCTFSGRLLYEKTARNWQEFLKENYPIIIADVEDFQKIKTLPVEINENTGLIENLKSAIGEFASILSDRIHKCKYPKVLKYSSVPQDTFPLELVAGILQSLYNENKTIEEISEIYKLTYERVRDVHAKTIAAIVAGDVICENLILNKDIVDWVRIVRKECLYHPEDDLINIAGKNDEEMFYILGYDFVEVIDVKFVIPKKTIGIYSIVKDTVISVLREAVIPIDKEDFYERFTNHKKMAKVKESFSQTFIDNILSCEKLIDSKDGKIFLKTKYLTYDEQRLARFIYEEGKAVLSSEVREKFEQLYGRSITTNLSSLKKYGLINIQGNLWSYSDKELLPVKEYISNYAEEKIIFNYSDLKSDMESKGYVIPPEKSMRAYITEACRVDNDNREHFCHKDYVDDYSEYNWRNQSRDGLTNWILNQIKEYLSDVGKCDIPQLCDYIEKQARGTDFENRIRERVKGVIGTYSGEEYPFLLERNFLRKNCAVFDTIDFSTLGLKGGKYPFFIQIRSIILNELKKKEDSKILLVDAIKLVNESIEEPQNRNTVIRAISNKHLPSINAEVQNIDGNLYIIKVGDDIAPEPVYKIEYVANAEETEVAQEVECEEIRDRISYRLSLEWEKLESAMRRELSFYRNWMERDHIDFDEAIKKFVVFIKNATNGNLSNKLPQNLYEYWYASTDFFDRNMYVSNLTLFFEGLLSEIKFQKEGIRLHKKGLGDWTLEYPSIARCLGLPSKLLKGFDRIFCDLYFKRNRVAHGEPVDMSSADTARTISDYIALYIFTVAKYM